MTERIRMGHVTLTRLPPKDSRVWADDDARPYLRAVDELGRILAPGTWALAGGLAIPISVGTFYRRHMDIDIVMPLTRLGDVVEAFQAAGYELYTSWTVSHHARGLLLECRMRSIGGLVRLRPRRLYVKRAGPSGAHPLLEKIDLYPYRERGRYLETCNTRQMLAGCAMQHQPLGAFGASGHVNCLGLEIVAGLKASRSGAKHRLDRAVIRDGPDAARAWFRARAIQPQHIGTVPCTASVS